LHSYILVNFTVLHSEKSETIPWPHCLLSRWYVFILPGYLHHGISVIFAFRLKWKKFWVHL